MSSSVTRFLFYILLGKGGKCFSKKAFFHEKSKAIPLQAWTGPEGSRRLRLPDFKTMGT